MPAQQLEGDVATHRESTHDGLPHAEGVEHGHQVVGIPRQGVPVSPGWNPRAPHSTQVRRDAPNTRQRSELVSPHRPIERKAVHEEHRHAFAADVHGELDVANRHPDGLMAPADRCPGSEKSGDLLRNRCGSAQAMHTKTMSASATVASSETRRTTWRSVMLVVPRPATVVSTRSRSRANAGARYSIVALRTAGHTPFRSNKSIPGPRASASQRARSSSVSSAAWFKWPYASHSYG